MSTYLIAPFLTNNRLRLMLWSLAASAPQQHVTSLVPHVFQALSARNDACLSSEAHYLNCSVSPGTGKNSFCCPKSSPGKRGFLDNGHIFPCLWVLLGVLFMNLMQPHTDRIWVFVRVASYNWLSSCLKYLWSLQKRNETYLIMLQEPR